MGCWLHAVHGHASAAGLKMPSCVTDTVVVAYNGCSNGNSTSPSGHGLPGGAAAGAAAASGSDGGQQDLEHLLRLADELHERIAAGEQLGVCSSRGLGAECPVCNCALNPIPNWELQLWRH